MIKKFQLEKQRGRKGLSGSGRARGRGFISAMVVHRSVVEMVLERGETRHDVVVNGLKEIALCGKVSGFALLSSVCGCTACASLSVRAASSLGEDVIFRPDRILTLRLRGGRRV